MNVPFFRPSISSHALATIEAVLSSGQLSTGPCCAALEDRFRNWNGVEHAIGVNSCTAALHLALACSSVGPNDAVFIPALAFASDWQVVNYVGATAVLVDSDPSTLCMCPRSLLRAIKALKTSHPNLHPKAVIVIDYAGQMADYEAIKVICRDWQLTLIEDAAHSMPAATRLPGSPHWQRAGAVADWSCFSLYATKPVTAGQGGMLMTNDAQLAARARKMRFLGLTNRSSAPYEVWNREVGCAGFKYNLPDLGAALALCQFDQLYEHWGKRRDIAQLYSLRLGCCPELRLPTEVEQRRHAWHLYVVLLKTGEGTRLRELLVETMFQKGIELSVHWRPLHLQPYVAVRSVLATELTVVDELYPTMISLPLFPDMTAEEVDYVCHHLIVFMNEHREADQDSALAPSVSAFH